MSGYMFIKSGRVTLVFVYLRILTYSHKSQAVETPLYQSMISIEL